MKNYFRLLQISIVTLVLLLVACGEDSSPIIMQTSQNFIEVVEDESDLPECTEDNVGEQYIVQGESFSRICIGGKWSTGTDAGKDTVYLKNKTVSCVTRELLDHSGVKIVCDGDSVGVLLNGNQGKTGEKGEKGIDGAGCSLVRVSETSVRLFCGGDSTTVYLGVPPDTTVKDSVVEPDAAKEDSTKGCTLVRMDSLSVRLFCDGDSITLYEHALPDTATEVPVKEDSTKNCKMERIDSLSVRLVCDGDSIVLYEHTLPDTSSAEIPVELGSDSVIGYAQKGPFVAGGFVYFGEYLDENTVQAQNFHEITDISNDEGRFSFLKNDRTCRYLLLHVGGISRNEVTGEIDADDSYYKINAIVDVKKHDVTNVNVLTHLEYGRIASLMTQPELTIGQAKRVVHDEILHQFYIDGTDFSDFESMNIFGTSESDAALLAVSILLLADPPPDRYRFSYIESVYEDLKDGSWDADSVRSELADWAMDADLSGRYSLIRQNMLDWGMSETVPDFEKYLRIYWSMESGLGICGKDASEGTISYVKNPWSKYYIKNINNVNNINGTVLFVCENAKRAQWRKATEQEMMDFLWRPENTKDGKILKHPTTGEKYVWDSDTLRHADSVEIYRGRGCVSYIRDTSIAFEGQLSYFTCSLDGWQFDIEKNSGTMKDAGGKKYRTVTIGNQVWMAENMNYKTDSSYCYDNSDANCDKYGRLYVWSAAMTVCPAGWHLPSYREWFSLHQTIESIDGRLDLESLKSKTDWVREPDGTDPYGFTVYPAGGARGGKYWNFGERSDFWVTEGFCAIAFMYYSDSMGCLLESKEYAYSVRCIKDSD